MNKYIFKTTLILCLLVGIGTSLNGQYSTYRMGWDVSPSPLDIHIGRRGSIQIFRDGVGQTYHPNGVPNSSAMFNGLFMLDGDYLIASFNSALDGFNSFWLFGSVSDVSGSGTSADPWEITAFLDSRFSDHEIIVTYSYVNGNEWFDVAMTPIVPDNNDDVIKVFHIIDTYLGGSDSGPAYTSGTAPYSVVGVDGGDIFESFVVGNTPWDRYGSMFYDTILNEPWNDGQLSNTLNFDPLNDNAIGVQWTLGVVQGVQPTITYRIGFTEEEIAVTSCGLILLNRHIGYKVKN